MFHTSHVGARLLVMLFMVAACRARSDVDSGGSSAMQIRQFPELGDVQYSGVRERLRVVIRDSASWNAQWRQLTATLSPSPAVPGVDFSREMVVVAAMGTQRSGGYSIHIDSVSARNGRLSVVVREVSPGKNCMTTMALTSPAVAVRVSRRDEEASFVEQSVTNDCP
jgi:hypothetical protein